MCLGSSSDVRGFSGFSKWLIDLKQCPGNAIGTKILMFQLQKYMDVYILRKYVVLCIMKNMNQCKKTFRLTPNWLFSCIFKTSGIEQCHILHFVYLKMWTVFHISTEYLSSKYSSFWKGSCLFFFFFCYLYYC